MATLCCIIVTPGDSQVSQGPSCLVTVDQSLGRSKLLPLIDDCDFGNFESFNIFSEPLSASASQHIPILEVK